MGIEQLNSALARLATLRSQAEKASSKVEEIWCQVEEERRKELLEILKERGLMLCGWVDPHQGVGATEEENLGLFPESSMRLLFEGVSQLDGEHYSEHEEYAAGRSRLRHICPHHFPDDPNKILGRSQYRSEVRDRDGSLIRLIDSIEIDIPIEEPKIREEVYERFGLTPLPDLPHDL